MENMDEQNLGAHLTTVKFLITLLLFPMISLANSSLESEKASLLCPRVAEKFPETTKKTLLNMEDIVKAKRDLKQAYEDIYFFMLDKNKDQAVLKELDGIEVTIKSVKEKHSRAKSNYNTSALEMGSYLTKAKKCWGSFNKDQKDLNSSLMNMILKEKLLSSFKDCSKKYDRQLDVAQEQYKLAILYKNKKIDEKKMVADGKIIQSRATQLSNDLGKLCVSMSKEEFYEDKILELFELNLDKTFTPKKKPKVDAPFVPGLVPGS